jgi:hypothetical protein
MFQLNVSCRRRLTMLAGAWVVLSGCLSVEGTEKSRDEARLAEPEPERNVLSGDTVCHTEDLEEEDLARVESEFQRLRVLRATRAAGTVTVPVYFHVIRRGTGTSNGDIPQARIDAQLAVLNQAFRNSPFRFQLMETDRTTQPAWFRLMKGGSAEFNMMNALRRGGAGSLNIYSVSYQGGMLGWSAFPWDLALRPVVDGVVISYASLPGGSQVPFNQGATAVHMVGHWLGVLHTFEEGCFGGDGVSDTPMEDEPAFGCPADRDTCPGGGVDPINNYMDMTDDACRTSFTQGQSDRMDAFGAAYRL